MPILEVTVKSIRAVDWQSMRPVFHGLSAQSARGVPRYVYDQQVTTRTKIVLNQLVRALPTVTVIELDIVIREMRAVVDQVARALELVLGVILMVGTGADLRRAFQFGWTVTRDALLRRWVPVKGWCWVRSD